jgi:hypothetical protein
MAAAMQKWEHAVIEEAPGEDAAAVLPEAILLAELRRGCRGISGRCCGSWRGKRGRRSMRC